VGTFDGARASIPPCIITLLRDPVARFESAWRYGFSKLRKDKDEAWALLLQRFKGGAGAFIAEARAANLSVLNLLTKVGVIPFDPNDLSRDGICCRPLETPLFSPQHWWVEPASLFVHRRHAQQHPRATVHVLCTESLGPSLSRLLTNLSVPNAHQPIQVLHKHATKKSKVLDRVSSLSPSSAAWVRSEYARDARLHRLYCGPARASVSLDVAISHE
jgi:hypothetical protein